MKPKPKSPLRRLPGEKKPPAPKRPVVVIPELKPCPRCGVRLEAGGNDLGLAWHGCIDGRFKPGATIDDAVSWVLVRLQQQILDGEVSLPDGIRLLADLRKTEPKGAVVPRAVRRHEEDEPEAMTPESFLGVVPKQVG